MELSFAKLTGAGNDFVAIDNMNGTLNVEKPHMARLLCDRHFGVGADGLLVLEKSSVADFTMMYYNADGSYGGMCGNGGRCAAFYAHKLGIAGETLSFLALDHIYRASISGCTVKLAMKDPVSITRNIAVEFGGTPWTCHQVDTGAPHVVIFTTDLDAVDVQGTGRGLREHERFAPQGTNINFVQITGTNRIAMRTYERGVEAETLACGTGSVASSVISCLERGLRPPVKVTAHSGEILTVDFSHDGTRITEVTLEGPADILFTGKALYEGAKSRIYQVL